MSHETDRIAGPDQRPGSASAAPTAADAGRRRRAAEPTSADAPTDRPRSPSRRRRSRRRSSRSGSASWRR